MKTWVQGFPSNKYVVSMRRHWLWTAMAGAGLVVHAGTALLRLNMFFPVPKLLDFAGFYASAWAIRQGLSPYNLSAEWLETLQRAQGIPLLPPPIFNPPFWPWLLQPLTCFRFPVAAAVWLVLNLALLAWATTALADIAGYRDRRARLILFFLVVTFGPVFLDLTLGQTSVLLLAAALAIGRSLNRQRGPATPLIAAISAGLAVGAKLFPLTWLGAWPLLRRWRELALAATVIVATFGIGFLASPESSQLYGHYLFTERLATSSEVISVDDQSLIAWLDRLARPQTFVIAGLGLEQRHTVVWSPPWTVNAEVVRWLGYVLLALLMLVCLFLLRRATEEEQEATFYLWILYGLLALLHIERYNHVLLLPAMAWLWSRGRRQRRVVIATYALVALSRLTHFWAVLLPAPWGPLVVGVGTYAVLLLGLGIMMELWPLAWHRVRG